METSNRSAFLRQALFADAIGSGACTLALLALAKPLASILELPAELLFGVGLSFVPFVALVTLTAWPAQPRAALVRVVIALNFAWALASAALWLSGEVTPNGLGHAFIAAQTLFVVGIAELEWLGVRRAQSDLGGNSRRSSASVGAPT
jgi:hypothetical protein